MVARKLKVTISVQLLHMPQNLQNIVISPLAFSYVLLPLPFFPLLQLSHFLLIYCDNVIRYLKSFVE